MGISRNYEANGEWVVFLLRRLPKVEFHDLS